MGWELCVSHWKLIVLVGHFVFRAGKLSVPMLFVFLDDSFAFLGVGNFIFRVGKWLFWLDNLLAGELACWMVPFVGPWAVHK